MYNAKISH